MIPVPRLDVSIRNHRGTMYLARDEHSLALSGVAVFIWRALDGRASLADVAAAVAEEYAVDQETAYTDCGELVEELAKAGMLDLKN